MPAPPMKAAWKPSVRALASLEPLPSRSVVREVAVFDYRYAVPDTGASTVIRLGESPLAARDTLLARLEQPAAGSVLEAPVPRRSRASA